MPKLDVPQLPQTPQAPELSSYYTGRLLESNAEAQAGIGRDLQSLAQKNADTANRGSAEMVNATNQMAERMSASGQKYYDEAQHSINDAIVNNAYAGASTEFAQAVQNRISKPYDDSGNPTFGTLPNDISNIGQQIAEKYSKGMVDADTSTRFNDQFQHLVTNHTINGVQVAHKQQVDYSVASVNKVIDSSVQNGLTDIPANLDFHYAQGVGAINNAVKNGYVSRIEADKSIDQLRSNLYVGSLSKQISANPGSVADALTNKSDDQLHITEDERGRLSQQIDQAFKASDAQEKLVVTQQQQKTKEQQNFNNGELQLAVAQGKAGPSDVLAKYQNGGISHDQYIKQMVDITKSQVGSLKQATTQRALSSDIQSGKVLSNYSEADVNKHYVEQVNTLGDKATIQDKAVVAISMKAPVTNFTKELSGIAKTGAPQDIAGAAKAYDYANEKNPLAVSKLTKQDRAFYSSINEQMKYTNKNPDQIINDTKNLVYGKQDPGTKNVWQSAYIKDHDLNPATLADPGHNIENTLMNTFNMPSGSKIQPDVLNHMQGLLHDAYMMTGDKASALNMLKDETKGMFGTSEINGGKAFDPALNETSGGKTLMFAPPEKIYDRYTPQELRQDLVGQATGLKLPPGVKPEDIQVGSDEITKREPHGMGADGKAATSYNMYYMQNGREVPVMMPDTGQPARWKPNTDEIDQNRVNSAMSYKSATIEQRQSIDRMYRNLHIPNPYNTPIQSDPTSSSITNVKKGIASVETPNMKEPYAAVGPTVHGNDNALGKYQVMASNLPTWSKEALGYSISKQTFLNRPDLQEKIVNTKLNQLMNQYHNVQDVFSVWHSGRPLADAIRQHATDLATHLKTSDYVKMASKGSGE